jgi:hypothetical protein
LFSYFLIFPKLSTFINKSKNGIPYLATLLY